MTVYLVRWPSLTASLVRAESEEHLLDTLDQIGNPEDCEWSVYEGPLAIDFRLPAEWSIRDERRGEPIAPDQVVVGDLGPMTQRYVGDAMEVSLGALEDSYDMVSAVLEKAFPKVHAETPWCLTDEGLERDGVLPQPKLRQALHAELARMLKASWRRAHLYRKTDAISTVAREMDMPVDLVRRIATMGHDAYNDGRKEGDDVSADRETADDPLFKVSNRHAQSCGEPPSIDGDEPGKYVGYFVNEYGEQAVYVYDEDTGKATVTMGDAGWQAAYPVVNGEVTDLRLTQSEQMWVRACWLATGALKAHR